MTIFLCFVIVLHVVSFANLYVIKNLNLNLDPQKLHNSEKFTYLNICKKFKEI